MKQYKLGVAIPYYKQNLICSQLYNYLKEIIELQLDLYQLNEDILVLVYENEDGLPKARNKLMNELIPQCEYITFIDSDDRIGNNYLEVAYDYLLNYDSDIFVSDFYINDSKFEYDGLKNHVTGVIYKTELIKNIRFNENRNIGEDMEFNQEVRKLNPEIQYLPCAYYYNYGANNDCLTYRYSRNELAEFKGSDS